MMLYSHYYLVLTLVSIVGLALPSDHESSMMTQRKIAKGSKKNPSLLFREELRVSLVALQAIEVPDLKTKVTEVVLGILNGEERRGLEISDLDTYRNKIDSFAVQITGMTEKECVDKYSNVVRCHEAAVMIESKEAFKDLFSKLKDSLGNVLVRRGVAVSSNKKGGLTNVRVTNNTPYDVKTSGNKVEYGGWGFGPFCSDDKYLVNSGQTWSATSSRGICMVGYINAELTLPDGDDGNLICTPYNSVGTSYSQYYIIMKGDNACCVQSSHESGVCA